MRSQLRGRTSVAPNSSEMVDGGLFLAITTGIYASVKIFLVVLGKGAGFAHASGAVAGLAGISDRIGDLPSFPLSMHADGVLCFCVLLQRLCSGEHWRDLWALDCIRLGLIWRCCPSFRFAFSVNL